MNEVKTNCSISLIVVFYLFRINMIEMPAQFVSLASGPTPPYRQAECILAYSRLSITSEIAAGARKDWGSWETSIRPSPSLLFPNPACSFVPVN